MGSATALDPYERALRAYWAPRLDLDRWWPGRSRWEVIVGAILVQNTAWTNVAKAIATLRAARRLSRARLGGLTEAELGALIRSSGFWRQKSRCLRGFALWLSNAHRGSLRRLFAQPTFEVRRQLLALPGIGPETADAILLFAGGHPSFILDNYTRRIFQRHRLPAERAWIEAALPPASGARAEPAWRGSSRARAGALGPAPT
ncbi:MAG: endonuclease III domain-containing protein, partial [Terriglobales bacterium]